mgnify:CR=1 FL=1
MIFSRLFIIMKPLIGSLVIFAKGSILTETYIKS